MSSRRSILWTVAASVLVFSFNIFAAEMDDTLPEVTDRVARFTLVSGDVQIRHDGIDEWEKAEANLPLVEGDEIVTGADGKVELQFSGGTHVWLDRGGYLRVPALTEEGVALSLVKGSMVFRLLKFDTDREYFEVDGPGSTVSVKDKGTYRIDIGTDTADSVRVSVIEGSARVYSSDSGLTLRSGRSALLEFAGTDGGEWQTGGLVAINDELSSWVADRENEIDKRLSNAFYDKYYDQDLYGAEDLSDNGDWIYTSDYGYVWRPYDQAIRGYSDWSPYRYGSWRWVPPFGWTWVNDEPWGWVTYHHGRWLYWGGRWVWAPYGYYRSTRSWWYPALVIIRAIGRDICWYPLSYRQPFYDFNAGYHDWVGNRSWRRGDRGHGRRPPNGTVGGVTPSPTPRFPGGPVGKVKPAPDPISDKGLVVLPIDDFGTGRGKPASPPPMDRRGILAKFEQPDTTPVKLPGFKEIKPRLDPSVAAKPDKGISKGILTKTTGVIERKNNGPVERELDRISIFRDRQPRNDGTPIIPQPGGETQPRDTGVFSRPTRPKTDVEPADPGSQTPGRGTPSRSPRERQLPAGETPGYVPQPKVETPSVNERPRKELPAPKQEQPKPETPRATPQPTIPRNDPPRSEPRRDPPPRQEPKQEPRSEPAPRRDPPAPKSDPPPKSTPAPKSDPPSKSTPAPERSSPIRKKDNR